MRAADRLLPFHLVVVLTVGGIITATPRMPWLWNHIDPWLFLVFDGQWMIVDGIYGFLAGGTALWLARRLLPVARWPLHLLLAWLPYGLWALVSAVWSRFPEFSLLQWILEVFLGIAALIFGYSVGYGQDRFRYSLRVALVAVFGYLFIRFTLQADQLISVGFDIVLASFWLASWMPVLICWLSDKCERDTGFSLFVATLSVGGLSFFVPQRMYALTMCMLTVATFLAYGRLRIEPKGTPYWRGYMVAMVTFFWWAYMIFAQSKPSSYIPGRGQLDGAWYRIFVDSERYEIFSYWLRHGCERLWQGVGLGWQLPAMAYNRMYQHEMILPELSYSHAHNFLINIWLQLGLIGVFLYVFWLVAVAIKAGSGFPSQTAQERRWTVAIFGMLMVLLLRNAVDDGMREGNVFLFWFLVGLLLGRRDCLGYNRKQRI